MQLLFVCVVKFSSFARLLLITFPTQSCLLLNSFYASLLHSVTIWLTVTLPLGIISFCFILLYYTLPIFPPALADDVSREFEQVSSSIINFRLNIRVDLNNAVVWMVSARSAVSNSPDLQTTPLGIVLSAPITINITITFMFHRFF